MARYTAYECPKKPMLPKSNMSVLRAPKDWRKQRLGMSENHLALIRQLWCATCGSPRHLQVHHLKGQAARKERGISLRATDKWGTPLCAMCHDSVERIGSRKEWDWFRDHGVDDPYALAQALWLATGDVERMQRVLIAHRER